MLLSVCSPGVPRQEVRGSFTIRGHYITLAELCGECDETSHITTSCCIPASDFRPLTGGSPLCRQNPAANLSNRKDPSDIMPDGPKYITDRIVLQAFPGAWPRNQHSASAAHLRRNCGSRRRIGRISSCAPPLWQDEPYPAPHWGKSACTADTLHASPSGNFQIRSRICR